MNLDTNQLIYYGIGFVIAIILFIKNRSKNTGSDEEHYNWDSDDFDDID